MSKNFKIAFENNIATINIFSTFSDFKSELEELFGIESSNINDLTIYYYNDGKALPIKSDKDYFLVQNASKKGQVTIFIDVDEDSNLYSIPQHANKMLVAMKAYIPLKEEEYSNLEGSTKLNNYGLGTINQFADLKKCAKNIPVHKLLSNCESEAEYTKNLLAEGKKTRRILESKLVTTDNDAHDCMKRLVRKIKEDIDKFKGDMQDMIKKNEVQTKKIEREVQTLISDFKVIKKDVSSIEQYLQEGENQVGVIEYWTGFENK